MKTSEFDINGFFFVQRLTLQGIGIDVTSINRTFKRPFLTFFLNMCLILIFFSWGANCWNLRNDDLEKILDAVMPFFQTFTSSFKVFILMFKHKKMITLVQRIYSAIGQASTAERLIVAAENKTDILFSKFYLICVSTLSVVTSVIPQFLAVAIYLQTGHLKMLMPIKFVTPFDQNQPPYFFLTAAWIIAGTYFSTMGTTAVDTLYSWFVHNISAQFRVLQQKFKLAAEETFPAGMESAVVKCIKQHQIVTELAQDFNEVFREIIFIEFSLNGLQTCLLAYQLGNGVSLKKIPFLVAFLVMMMTQFMIYCYGGQRIQDESSMVGTKVYEVFPWHRLTVRLRKYLLLSMLRAQRLCIIGGFMFRVDWKLFIWVVRNTFSMITLLQSVADGGEVG